VAYDDAGNFQNSIAATLTAGPLNNLGARNANGSPTLAGWVSGSTNCLFLTPAVGGTTINSLDASGCSNGFTALISNESVTDNLIFTHLGGGLARQSVLEHEPGQRIYPALRRSSLHLAVSPWRC
jgi:hypothetical protein